MSLHAAPDGKPSPQQTTPTAAAERGAELFRQGDWAGAITAFDQAIAQDPKNARAYLGRAGSKLKLGDQEGAKADFALAFTLDSRLAAEAVHVPKDPAEEFTQAIRRNPRDGKAYVSRGWIRAERGDHKGAEQDFTAAIELDPKVTATYIDRGKIRALSGDYVNAIADFSQVLLLEPKNAEAYNLRGTLKGMQADWNAAIVDLRKAVELDPKLKGEIDPLIEECERGLTTAQQETKK